MDSNFFTNEGENTLKNRINHILQRDKNIEYLDFLIGYFRITGFDKISDNLSSIKHTRILVGINADKHTYNASQLIKRFSKEQVDIYNEEPLEEQEYQNFFSMKQLIREKKIELRISANRDVHSKMYIMRSEEYPNHRGDGIAYNGRLIIGSSNLTHNGLEGNTEINAELNQERDIVDAVKVFEKLWEDSVELTEDDFGTFITPNLKKPPNDEGLSPYQVYIKSLQIYFGKRVDLLDFNNDDMPKDFKSFNYQSDAVQDGISKLAQYNGFYLADVVGLGKTIIAILIIKRLKIETLIIAPNSVLNQWRKSIKDFKIDNIKCVSKDSIPSSSKAKLIVIDEAHNFRNVDIDRYKKLENICKCPHQKKLMLLSATPQNNEPNDIAHQLYLFQNQNNSNIPNLLKLKAFFDAQNSKYKKIIKDTQTDGREVLAQISDEIKSKVLKYIMIRRTRTDIENCDMYSSDVDDFPKLSELTPLKYNLKDEDLIEKYNQTAKYLQDELEYARFQALNKLNEQGRATYKSLHPHLSDNIFDDNPLDALMRTQLVKRFESSFEAFKISIDRHTRRLEKFIKKFKDNKVYLGKNSNDFLDDKENYFIEDNRVSYWKMKNKKKIKKTLSGYLFTQDDFEDDFLKLLEEDLEIFQELNKQWKDENRDPKLEVFKKELEQYRESKTKVVVFTESKDTGRYLHENLVSEKLKILYIDSSNRNENIDIIAKNFDANIAEEEQENDYNIIITTDTLAEGINLHRSNTIYNYDIPWNSTKLMQRIGRINRIGSRARTYNVYNFKPVAKSEELIGLSHKAHTKLQSFHSTYGEDNKIYTDNEEVETKELFEIMELQKEEIDEELQFLQELRTFKNEHPKEFLMLESLNEEINMSVKDNPYAYSYKKADTVHKFYKVDENINEIDFITFASDLKSISTSKKVEFHESELEILQKRIDEYYQVNTVDKQEMQQNDTQQGSNDGKAIRILKNYVRTNIISNDLRKSSVQLIQAGIYTNLSKEIIKSNDSDILDILKKKKVTGSNIKILNTEDLKFVLTFTKDI